MKRIKHYSAVSALSMLVLLCTPVFAQSKADDIVKSHSVKVPSEFASVSKQFRLKKALQSLWQTTESGKTYSISGVFFPRAMNGTFTSQEHVGPYTFGPSVTADEMIKKGPLFVELLLGQYSDQESQALKFLENALANYFSTSVPGQKTQVGDKLGQLTRNDDGTATYTDGYGQMFFILDADTSGRTIATMAPEFAAALTDYSGSITPGFNNKQYAKVDLSNTNILINHDGRVYDRDGRYLGNPENNAAKVTGSYQDNTASNTKAVTSSSKDNPSSSQSSSPASSDNPCHLVRSLNGGGRVYCNQ